METKVITFRCPDDVLQIVDESASRLKRSRSTMILAALRIMARQLEEQSKSNTPIESLLTDKGLFPRPESKGGRPRKNPLASAPKA